MADSGAGGGSIQGAPAPSKGRKSKGTRKGGNSRGSRKSSGRGSGGGFDDPRPDRPSMLDLRTIYEGAAGKRTNRMLWKTTLVITNRCVEIEREGANAILSCLTMGCWYFMFQTATIEIYEYSRIAGLHMTSDDAIVIEMEPTTGTCGLKTHPRVVITLPEHGSKTAEELFNEMKAAWNMAHGINLSYGADGGAIDDFVESESDEDDGLLGLRVEE